MDALDGNMWGRATFHGEEEDHRNLYHQLIGSEERPDEFLFFILDVLELLPASDLRQYMSKLRDILLRIEVNQAPKLYIRKLATLIHVAESGVEASSSSAQKRPALASFREDSKRARGFDGGWYGIS